MAARSLSYLAFALLLAVAVMGAAAAQDGDKPQHHEEGAAAAERHEAYAGEEDKGEAGAEGYGYHHKHHYYRDQPDRDWAYPPECPTCPTGTKKCGNECIDTQNSLLNCGDCGKVCPLGTANCIGGACQCDTGFINCGSPLALNCVDNSTDVNNCGTCGNSCDTGAIPPETCVGGVCTTTNPCTPPDVQCLNAVAPGCVDLNTNKDYCGSCNRRCLLSGCNNGKCCNLVGDACLLGTFPYTCCDFNPLAIVVDGLGSAGCKGLIPGFKTCCKTANGACTNVGSSTECCDGLTCRTVGVIAGNRCTDPTCKVNGELCGGANGNCCDGTLCIPAIGGSRCRG